MGWCPNFPLLEGATAPSMRETFAMMLAVHEAANGAAGGDADAEGEAPARDRVKRARAGQPSTAGRREERDEERGEARASDSSDEDDRPGTR